MLYSTFAKQYLTDKDVAEQLKHDADISSFEELHKRLLTLKHIMARYQSNSFAQVTFQLVYKKLQGAVYDKQRMLQAAPIKKHDDQPFSLEELQQQDISLQYTSQLTLEQRLQKQILPCRIVHKKSQQQTKRELTEQRATQLERSVQLEPNVELGVALDIELGVALNNRLLKMIALNPTTMLLQYYQQQGIIDEQSNCILQTLCLARGLHFGIEGYSGTGKTKLADALLAIVPEKKRYHVELQSPTALWYDAERVNNAVVVYIPELQKVYPSARSGTPMIAEIIKSLTENRPITRRVTMPDKSLKEINLLPGATLMYTLALENSFKKDKETTRRLICLQTDASPEHRKHLKEEKAAMRFFKNEPYGQLLPSMQAYMAVLINECKLWSIKDPYAPTMHNVVPATLRGASFLDHYFNLVEAHTYFHRYQRMSDDKKRIIFTSITDHLSIQHYYLPQLLSSLETLDTHEGDKLLLSETRDMLHQSQPLKIYLNEASQRMQKNYPILASAWTTYEQQKLLSIKDKGDLNDRNRL